MVFTTKADAKRRTGISYLGSVNMTTKHQKASDYCELTYALYLAPAKLSGYEVCPMRNAECTALCLNESGMSIIYTDMINQSRIKKTKLFFEEREFFMGWMIAEIESTKKKAEKMGYAFSVRLNNTSDINPISFYVDRDGKKMNVLQLFPTVQFYDYTKVANRLEVVKKYPNYDLTFSFSGYNEIECLTMLKNNVNVAVVLGKIQVADVLEVAASLKMELTPEEIYEIVKWYPRYEPNYPNENWAYIVEDMLNEQKLFGELIG